VQHKKIVHTVLWLQLKREAKGEQKKERLLASFLHASITAHKNFSDALGYVLASKLAGPHLSVAQLTELIADAHRHDKSLANKALLDLAAILERDPAVHTALQGFLYLKGFHALQAYRVAHYLWKTRRHSLAYYLQSRISEITSVDIHPAAKIGYGVMMDHATGVVIGETTGLGNNVSMLHGVTLGAPGKTLATGIRRSATGFCLVPAVTYSVI